MSGRTSQQSPSRISVTNAGIKKGKQRTTRCALNEKGKKKGRTSKILRVIREAFLLRKELRASVGLSGESKITALKRSTQKQR